MKLAVAVAVMAGVGLTTLAVIGFIAIRLRDLARHARLHGWLGLKPPALPTLPRVTAGMIGAGLLNTTPTVKGRGHRRIG